MLRSLVILFAAFFLAGAVACGGDDDSGSSSAPSGGAPAASGGSDDGGDEDEDSDDGGAPQAPSGGGSGVLVVDGESHDVEQVLRCEPDLDFVLEESLDLAVIAAGGQLQLLINVDFAEQLVPVFENGSQTGYENQALQSQSVDLQGGAANGLWGGGVSQNVLPPNPEPDWYDGDFQVIDGPPLVVDGNRLSGSMTLADFYDSPATVDVSVDIMFPSEAIDCRLGR
jgi:hypothetical protein